MSAKRKQRIRQSMEALYGRDIEEDRFINYHYHRKRKWVYICLSVAVVIAAIASCIKVIDIWQHGYVLAIGERIDGTRYIGLLENSVIRAEQQKTSAAELAYSSLQTCDVLIVGIISVVLIGGVALILLIGRARESQKFIRRKLEYDRIQGLKKDEQSLKKVQDYDYAHKSAPEVVQDENFEEGN